MKIALVAYLHGYGGAERQITVLANEMAKRKHEVHFIILTEDKRCYELEKSIHIHSLINVESGSFITRLAKRRKALIKTLGQINCDVVINFNFQSAYFLAFSNKKKIGKVIYSERGDPGDKEYKGLMGLIRRLVLHKINSYVFQSKGAQVYFKDKYVQQHSTVIPNACFISQCNQFGGTRENRIVTIGRLAPQKNQKLLLKSFALIANKYPQHILELYGDGELKEELESLAVHLGISKQVKFRGTTKNIKEEIKNASLFVLSSDYEGIPNALIEAMAIGLPCVSTDCKPGGARTLIQNGENGMITPISNEEALAKAMSYVIDNPTFAEKIGSKAKEIIDILSPKRIYDKWEAHLIEVVKSEK